MDDGLDVTFGMKLCLLSALAVLAGGVVSVAMNGYKSGRGFYQHGLQPRMIAPQAVSALLSRMDRAEFRNLTTADRNRSLAEKFARDVRRMKWTEAGELEWENTKGPR